MEEVFAVWAAGLFDFDVEAELTGWAEGSALRDGLGFLAAGAFDFELEIDGAGFGEAFDFAESDEDGEEDGHGRGEDA